MQIHNQICNLLYYSTERRTWKSKRKSPGSFQISLAFEKTSTSSNKDFFPSSSPTFLYAPSRLKQSFSFPWWTVTSLHSKNVLQLSYYKIERTRNQPPYCLLQLQEKKRIPPPPVGLSWDSPHPPPESVRTDGRTLTSEPKFFGSTGYQICLPMVLSKLRYKATSKITAIKTNEKCK